jgi:hypothetical protein
MITLISHRLNPSCLVLGAALISAACSGNHNPVLPTPPSTPTLAPPAPRPGRTAAILYVTEFRRTGPNSLKLAMVEIGGYSGASFTIEMVARRGHDFGCGGTYHIDAGGTWNTDALGYCAPEGDGTDAVTAEIRFNDDDGRPGMLTVPLVARPIAPPGVAAAVLVVREFRRTTGNGLKLVLAEVGGRSGASFAPVMRHADGSLDFGCPTTEYIAPGGTWDMDGLDYCAPTGDGTDGVSAVIYFNDEAGRAGTLVATLARP